MESQSCCPRRRASWNDCSRLEKPATVIGVTLRTVVGYEHRLRARPPRGDWESRQCISVRPLGGPVVSSFRSLFACSRSGLTRLHGARCRHWNRRGCRDGGSSGIVVGADIAPEMLKAARVRLASQTFRPAAADGQALPFGDDSFDAVICQLGLQSFPDPALGLLEFRRVLRPGSRAAVCVHSTPDRTPMWSVLAETLSRFLP